jgi:hypothetical protein
MTVGASLVAGIGILWIHIISDNESDCHILLE